MSREQHTFTFYYRESLYGQDIDIETKMCKYPEMTKVYKDLLNRMYKGEVHTIGYKRPTPGETNPDYTKRVY